MHLFALPEKNSTFAGIMMTVTAKTLAELLGGEISGDPEVVVTSPARIEYAKKGNICFFANPKYEKYIYDTKASILLVNRSFIPKADIPATLIKVEDAYSCVPVLLEYFSSLRKSARKGNRFVARLCCIRTYFIAASARIGRGTHIYPQVYIGKKVRIGKKCIIYPGVKIYDGCEVGDNCIIHANTVIGADGFGFAPLEDGTYRKIPQLGNVIIGNNVELGACCTIDRATMGSTIIHDGVKLDDQCMIAHNVEVGENTVMAAQCAIAGSAKIGKHCIFGGKSAVAGHVTIADNTSLAGDSAILGNVKEEGKSLMGSPAFDYHQFMRAYALFKNAPLKR